MAMGVGFSHCEGTPSTWTLAKHDLPGHFEAAPKATGVNGDLLHWLWRLRNNDAKVAFALGAGAVKVFRHIKTVDYFDGLS